MKLKLVFDDDGVRRLVTASGEAIGTFLVDPEWVQVSLYASNGEPMRAKIVLEGIEVGDLPDNIVDADQMAVRALPAPRPALPDASQDPFDFLKDCYDYDPDDYASIVRDDEEEWEEG